MDDPLTGGEKGVYIAYTPSGGGHDGLMRDGINENQGAESTLSYLTSLIATYNLRGLTGKNLDPVKSGLQ